MAIVVPERSLDQRVLSLALANEVRSRRAQIKRDLRAGTASIHALIAEPPEYLEGAKVVDILLSVPARGPVKVGKVLSVCRISPSKTVGGLSERQRRELLALLGPDRRPWRPRPPQPAQRKRALSKANKHRSARADVKHRIVCGETSAAEVLRDPPGCLSSMSVGDLVCCQPRWGVVRCRMLLGAMLISEGRPIGMLTERQRVMIADRIELVRALGGGR